MGDYGRENPKPGDIYYHPLSFNRYLIHSVTDDGWCRYTIEAAGKSYPMYTQPTLSFINIYKLWNDQDGHSKA